MRILLRALLAGFGLASPLAAQTIGVPPTPGAVLTCVLIPGDACGQSFTVPVGAGALRSFALTFASDAPVIFQIRALDGTALSSSEVFQFGGVLAPFRDTRTVTFVPPAALALRAGAQYAALVIGNGGPVSNPPATFLAATGDGYAGGSAVRCALQSLFDKHCAVAAAGLDLAFEATFDATVTPEPATWMLVGVGLLALGGVRRRRAEAGRWLSAEGRDAAAR